VTAALLSALVLRFGQMSDFSKIVCWVAILGALGGTVRGLFNDKGFVPIHKVESKETTDGAEASKHRVVWHPGTVGDGITGVLGALIPFGLYGQFKDVPLLGPPPKGADLPAINMTLAVAIGALVAGAQGAAAIMGLVDKHLLKVAGSEAAEATPDPDKADALRTASPTQAVELTANMSRPRTATGGG
jgi:hypothetical protein